MSRNRHDQPNTPRSARDLETVIGDRMAGDSEPTGVSNARRLGPWRLVRRLSDGGMGTVWLAERADGAFTMKAAVKLIKAELTSPSMIRRFRRERQILADMNHSHICRLLDGGTTPAGDPFLVMEYLDGQHIDRFCFTGQLGTREILQLALDICDALHAAHARSIVHRDLKPSNILVTRAGEPKIVDFGIARAHESSDDSITAASQVLMTSAYASPEQWRKETVGPASDIFSLGLVLFKLLTGWLPDRPGLKGVHPPAELRAELGEALYGILARTVRADPDERYPSAEALARDLREYLAASAGALRVFICCRGDVASDVDVGLAFYRECIAAGAAPFLAPRSVTESDNWVRAVDCALRESDAFVLLLSRPAALSEMVAAETELALRLRGDRCESGKKPHIVPVRVHLSKAQAERYPLWGKLAEFEPVDWRGPADTSAVVAKILAGLPRSERSSTAAVSEEVSASQGDERSASSQSTELPGDVVSGDSPFYIERPGIDDRCLREVLVPGGLIRIKGPRQMGKTSLMNRLLGEARTAGVRTATIDLRLADRTILTDLDRFLRWLCAVTSRQLRVRIRPTGDHWDEIFGPKDNCVAYFEDHLLAESLVLAIDHLDRVFESESVADEFLALLRAWHEMGKSQEPWSRLRVILVHATEIYLSMNINHSPFNVGLSAALSDWDAGAVADLAVRHGLSMGQGEIDALMGLVDGHPHLVRLALYHMTKGVGLQDILATAATDEGLFADHLKHLAWQLQTQPELGAAAGRVMASREPIEVGSELAFKLASLGLVRLEGNTVRPARALYRRYFGG